MNLWGLQYYGYEFSMDTFWTEDSKIRLDRFSRPNGFTDEMEE